MTEASVLLSERLMIFNLLPSLTLHASRHDEMFPADWVRALCNADAALANAWHRHWSRWILCELGLLNQPVLSLDPPQLKVALLSTDALRTCAAHAGALLCAPRLRRAIDGAEVRTLHAALGRDVMNFAVSSRRGPCMTGSPPVRTGPWPPRSRRRRNWAGPCCATPCRAPPTR